MTSSSIVTSCRNFWIVFLSIIPFGVGLDSVRALYHEIHQQHQIEGGQVTNFHYINKCKISSLNVISFFALFYDRRFFAFLADEKNATHVLNL